MDQTRPPVVSVIIPTFNRSRFVLSAVKSALAQEQAAVEVVVVDDGSTEELPEINCERVRVIRHAYNRGVATARNTGIAASRGEWVAFLDDDDTWSPRKLRLELAAAETAGASFAYGGAAVVDSHGQLTDTVPAPDPDGLLSKLLRYNAIPAGASNVLARRAAVVQVGGFDEAFSHFADWDLWIRLAASGNAASVDEAVVAYCHHARSMGPTETVGVSGEVRRFAEKHAGLAAAFSTSLDDAAMSWWIGRLHARGNRRVAAAAAFLRGSVTHLRRGDLRSARLGVRQSLGALGPGVSAVIRNRRSTGQVTGLPWATPDADAFRPCSRRDS